MILIEENFQTELSEAMEGDKKHFYIKGIFGEAETKNRNGRSYKLNEMQGQIERVNDQARAGRFVLGELDHPDTLSVSLKNVSHRIETMWMEGNQAFGKARILENHPNGQIAIGLAKDGITLGMSTRGAGKVNSDGIVENFNLVTVDLVATPSARSAYPQTIQEQLELYGRGEIVTDLAEGAAHNDPIAQKYIEMEMKKFANHLRERYLNNTPK